LPNTFQELRDGVDQLITRFLRVLTTGIKIQNKERGRLWIDGHLLGYGSIRHVASLPLVSATNCVIFKAIESPYEAQAILYGAIVSRR
jgi:hypothetical protein